MELIEITCQDKTTNKVSVFNANNLNNIVCICLPAMGVRASYYKIFADELALFGSTVITTDWRGQGHSSQIASFKTDFGYEHYVADLHEIVRFSQQNGIPHLNHFSWAKQPTPIVTLINEWINRTKKTEEEK